MGIRIDELPSTVVPTSTHVFPAMKDGLTVKLTIQQIATALSLLAGNAASVPFTPSGTLTSTNVQAAIAELLGEALLKVDNLNGLGNLVTARNNLGIPDFEDGRIEIYLISGTSLGIRPKNGDKLVISGISRPVVAATMANTLFTSGAINYVYATWSGTAIVYAASATVPVLGSDGRMVKTGDTASRLVGCVYRDSVSGNLKDDASFRGVLSWFNQRPKSIFHIVSGATAATINLAAVGTAANFISWRDQSVVVQAGGYVSNNATDYVFSGFLLNSVGAGIQHGANLTIGQFQSVGGLVHIANSAEALSTIQFGMRTSGASTATASGAIAATIMG